MDMKEVVTIMQLDAGATLVSATYLEGTSGIYHFKNVLGVPLRKDDLAVVETKGGFAIVKVVDPNVSVTDLGCSLARLCHVFTIVRVNFYEDMKAAEQRAYERLALSEVTSRLDAYRQQVGAGTFDDAKRVLMGKPATRPTFTATEDVIEEEG
ncbi:MAG: hypothetical protein FKY71_08080 [Spiribacter salinus]|uniref:Uncharacterized protein n=1 Tax=Spiribacter salinus TaxID=1335746 RepID=A0A540VS90_9GAMM|nr:MAG: hypothetical protein FKY71_08080 [Spiribacter salinus]